MDLLGWDHGFFSALQDSCGLRRQVDQLFNAGPRFGNRHFLQQSSKLHNEGDLAGREDLPDTDRSDQCQRYQHIRLNVECRNQSDDCLQNNGQAAQNDGKPRHVKREGLKLK